MTAATPKEDVVSKHAKVYDQLKKVRASTEVSLKPISMLRKEIVGLDGKTQALRIRYYQVQAIFHLLAMKRMVLGDATGTGKCVTGDTLVITDKGCIPIRDLGPAGVNLVPNSVYETDGRRVWTGSEMAPIKCFYWNGRAETRRIRTKSGYEVEGTFNHPVLVRNRDGGEIFKTLGELQIGDRICVARSQASFPKTDPAIPYQPDPPKTNAIAYKVPGHLTPPLARLLGYVVAEAWVNSTSSVLVTQDRNINPEAHDDIRELFLQLFAWQGNANAKTKDISVNVSSVALRKYFAACGVSATTSHFKTVPWCVMQGSEACITQFLRGLFEGEGHVDRHGNIEFATSSEQLGREVQVLLLLLGIVSSRRQKHVRGRSHVYWRLLICGDQARAFASLIRFVSRRKNQALLVLDRKRNPNVDVVPFAARTVARIKSALVKRVTRQGPNENRKGSGLKQYGRSFTSTLSHVGLGYRNPSYAFLSKLVALAASAGVPRTAAALTDTNAILSNRYFYDPLEVISEGSADVMDIEVDHPVHCFAGNGIVNHNTLVLVASLCYAWEKEPDNKAIVVCPKSALRQWASEIDKFTTGITVYVVDGTLNERKQTYLEFALHEGPSKPVMLMGYAPLVRDWNQGAKPSPVLNGKADATIPPVLGVLDGITARIQHLTIAFDEAAAFKSDRTKTWQVCRQLSERANRCYGLTATLLKNNLIEGFAIYKVIYPKVFSTKTAFLKDYCVTKLQRVAGSRKIPIVVGYKNLQAFRDRIDPFFLGRPKHEISTELPTLITREVACPLSRAEDVKYGEALTGILSLGDGNVKDYTDHRTLVSLIYCQKTVDSLSLLQYGYGDLIDMDFVSGEAAEVGRLGAKEQALLDLLTEEFEGEKVIVYCRFTSLIKRLRAICRDAGVESVEVSGEVTDTKSNPARKRAQDTFQDLSSNVRVIFISDAGSEAINLQAASAMILYNSPWSWGSYVQLLGRSIRIGSPHQHVVAIHLVAERPNRKSDKARKTIDHYTLEILQKKKELIDRVLGESAVGALEFGREGAFTHDLANSLRRSEEK